MKVSNKVLLSYSSLILLLVVLAFFWKVFIRGLVPLPGGFITGIYYPWLDYKWGYEVGVPVENPITADVVSFTYPMQTYAIESLKKGILPLWNPYILTGAPLAANFQSAPFAITNIVYWFFGEIDGWTARIILQHIIAAFSLYFLLRRISFSSKAAVLAGVIFAFSGHNTIWSQWNAHVLTAGFIGLLLLFLHSWIEEGKAKYLLLFSVTLFLQILSGYPQMIIYTIVALFIWWAFMFVKTKEYKKTFLLGLAGILGIGLASFQILPTAELLSNSQRVSEPLEYKMAFLPWEKIITFIAPDYFGNHSTGNYWGPQDYTSNTGFVTTGGLILALVSVINYKKSTYILPFTAIGVFGLLLSFPTPISLFLWNSGFLGLQAASAHRALVLWTFATAALSGIALDIVIKNNFRWKVPLVIIFSLLLVFYTLIPDTLHRSFDPMPIATRNLILPVGSFVIISLAFIFRKLIPRTIFIASIIFIIILELLWFWKKFTPFSPRRLVYPTTPIIEFLQNQEQPFRTTGNNVIPINLRMAYRIETLEGYDAIYPLRASQYISALNDSESVGKATPMRYAMVDDITDHLLSIANVKYVLTFTEDLFKFDPSRYEVVAQDKTVSIVEDKNVLPRAKMFYEWVVEEDPNEALKRIVSPDFQYNKSVVLEEDPGIISTKDTTSEVTYLSYSPLGSTIRINTASNGILFVSDLSYPGWNAYVDGKETEIIRGNYAFRAIPIPEGEHIVVMKYESTSLQNGVKLTLLSGIILIGAFVMLRYTYER